MKSLRMPKLIFSAMFMTITMFWILVRLPLPSQVLMDADGGYQLAGATQILMGEHPFADFEATYGPFAFYASALAQALSGNRFIGEIILVILSYAVAYAILAKLIYRVTANPMIVLFFGAMALAAIPRLYKYYLVLGPVLVLWAAWNYIEKPVKINMVLTALAVTITGLFRSDFGVYCFISGGLAVFIHPSFKEGGFKRVFVFSGLIILFATPYMIFLFLNGGLINYFHDMLIGGPKFAIGMSLPFPAFNRNQGIFSIANLKTLVEIFYFSLPPVLFMSLALWWKNMKDVERKMILVATVLYSFSLIQAFYRAEYLHLLQAIALAFLLTAWLVNKLLMNVLSFRLSDRRISMFHLICLIVVFGGVLLPAFLVPQSGWPKIDVRGIPEKLTQYTLPKDQMLANVNKNSHAWYPEMMTYIRRCTNEDQRLMALPALTTFYYFTDRLFAGGQAGIVSGYFVTFADQERIVDKMSQQDIPLILYVPNFQSDNQEERKFEVVAPIVASYIDKNYAAIERTDDALLLLRRDLKIEKQSGDLSDFSCPVHNQ